MIDRWFEPFTLLEKTSADDGLGGTSISYASVMGFQGVLCVSPAEEITMAGQTVRTEELVLLHEFDVTLAPGEYVRREKDGALYRVTDRSGLMRAPAFSGLRFAQVPVERLVIPC